MPYHLSKGGARELEGGCQGQGGCEAKTRVVGDLAPPPASQCCPFRFPVLKEG